MEENLIRYVDFHDVIECLIAAVESRDKYTSGHSSRVADITQTIAKGMAIRELPLEIIHMAAHMHDIGKIGIPDEILAKPGKLNKKEWQIVKEHPMIGYQILSKSNALQEIALIVLHHHERWDGKGYPSGLKGNDIPLGSRIITIADSIDSMLYKRPYKNPMTAHDCINELHNNSGSQFDPIIVGKTIKSCFLEGKFYLDIIANTIYQSLVL